MKPQNIVCILSIIGIVVSLLNVFDIVTAIFYILVIMVNHKRLLECYTTMIAYTIILMIIQIVLIIALLAFHIQLKKLDFVENLCALSLTFAHFIAFNPSYYWFYSVVTYIALALKMVLLIFLCRARDLILKEDGRANIMIKQRRMQMAQMKKQAQKQQKTIKNKKPYDNPCNPSKY